MLEFKTRMGYHFRWKIGRKLAESANMWAEIWLMWYHAGVYNKDGVQF